MPILGQHSQFQKKSPKPTSFESALSGISSFNFVGGDGDVDFIEAYFIEEIKKWMDAVRPGIRFGIDYSKPSPEHVNINYDFSYRQQLANNGVWWWVVSNAKVLFEIEGLEYKYEYPIPNFSVQSNNFSNHVLYNNLLKSVAGHSYSYNKAYSLHLAKYPLNYNEANLKASWRNEGCKLFEGIYENVSSDNGGKSNKYKLAMKYVNDKPYLIYLDGANLFDDWKEGEVKAWLEPTATPNIFKAQWLMAFKTISTAYVAFQNGAMQISISESNENDSYIKLFPSTTDDVAIEGAKPNEWTGTGFALKNNYIVTNYHVIDGAKSISILGINGNFTKGYSADVVATDKNIDLAILKVNGITIPAASIPYSVKTANAEVGEEVFVLGYPLTSTMGEEIKLTTGVISSRSGFQGDVSLYQTTAPIQPGNSGGPLFDSKGNIIGIVSAKHTGAENVGNAIKASYLRNLMESALPSNILPQNNKITGQNHSGKVKTVKNFVYYITCSSKANSNHSNNPNKSNSITTNQTKGKIFRTSYRKTTSCNLVINNIEIASDYTALYCQYTNTEYNAGGWYAMDPGAYIRDKSSGKKYVMTKTDNCTISPSTTSIEFNETKHFVLYFPPISPNTKEIDFVESNDSSWKIYGIKLIQ
jgi:S1-C subfamily serine protease